MKNLKNIIKYFFLTFILFVGLIGCQSERDLGTNPAETDDSFIKNEDNQTIDDSTSSNSKDSLTNDPIIKDEQAYMLNKLQESQFAEIEIEVEYADGREYEAEIEWEHNQIKAEIENELQDVYINGVEAFDLIYDVMNVSSIHPTAQHDVIIEQIIEGFNLPANYEEIEVEITFHDQSKLEFEIEK